MNKGKIIVAGIGPGSEADITPAVLAAIQSSDVIIGYKYYFRFITHLLREGTECIDTGMKREQARAEQAFAYANEGKTVCVISSGDAGIYGMTPLIYEMKKESGSEIEIESYPGISAFQKAASLLGAPIGHDFCVISLSDLMIPWELIEKRIHAAAMADFVTAIYNPKSEGRYWQLYRLKELFLQERKPETPVGYVRQAGREEQEVFVTTLADLDPEQIDMFTVVLIGNSQTYLSGNHMITPRGYYGEIKQKKMDTGIGQDIMIRSFRTIEKELKNQEKVMLMQTTGHVWTKEEVEGTTDLQREFNNYLNSFRSIVCYAAQTYGFYHEISRLTDNLGDFSQQLARHPSNALAVALSSRRNKIYRELILGSVEIVNDIRTACLSDNKMTEKERMEVVFGIRPKLKLMNKKLQRLTIAVKYTTMGDIWREIDEGARPVADKYDIVKAAQRRWRQIGRNVRP